MPFIAEWWSPASPDVPAKQFSGRKDGELTAYFGSFSLTQTLPLLIHVRWPMAGECTKGSWASLTHYLEIHFDPDLFLSPTNGYAEMQYFNEVGT